jgi:pyruvate-ferredoxin/flavodoxin oxidoreductase
VSAIVPKWDLEKCVQCNICGFLCPHSAIRPFLITDDEYNTIKKEAGGEGAKYQFGKAAIKGKIPNVESYSFVISISTSDCVGCSLYFFFFFIFFYFVYVF